MKADERVAHAPGEPTSDLATAPAASGPVSARIELYRALIEPCNALRQEPNDTRLDKCIDLLWTSLAPTGVSWIGFYVGPGEPSPNHRAAAGQPLPAVPDDEMHLGPSRNKPACNPIGLHGACGRAFTTRHTLIVRDVAALGQDYIACDPADRSELVIPCFREGTCWGVLDADSHDLASFGTADAVSIHRLLSAAGITDPSPPPHMRIG